MINSYVQNTQVMDYSQLGYDAQFGLVKNADFPGVKRKGFTRAVDADSQFEGFDIGKLLSNNFKQVMKMGSVTLDGVNGRITVTDERGNVRVILGNLK